MTALSHRWEPCEFRPSGREIERIRLAYHSRTGVCLKWPRHESPAEQTGCPLNCERLCMLLEFASSTVDPERCRRIGWLVQQLGCPATVYESIHLVSEHRRSFAAGCAALRRRSRRRHAESAAAAAAVATAFAASIFARLVLSLRRGAAMAFRAALRTRATHTAYYTDIDRARKMLSLLRRRCFNTQTHTRDCAPVLCDVPW